MLAHQLPPHESLCAHHEDLSSYLWFLIHHSYWPQILGANCPLVLSYLGNTSSNILVISTHPRHSFGDILFIHQVTEFESLLKP